MADYFVEAELAKTGRSTCRGCKQTIQKSALRISDSFEEDHFQSHPWHHAECFVKLSKRHIDLQVSDIKGYDSLSAEHKKTVRTIIQQIQQDMRNGVKPSKSKKTTTKAVVDKPKREPEDEPKKTKKGKSAPKKAKSDGLSSKQLKLFKTYCQEYEQLGAQELKAILSKKIDDAGQNNQPKTGNKPELVERCAEGKLLGRTPSCTECGGGKLRFNRSNGTYTCPGYMDDDDFKRCGRAFGRADITRTEWKEN